MGMILKKAYTMPAPSGAEVVEKDGVRIARWRLRNGQQRQAEVVDSRDGRLRVRGETKTYSIRFRDATGVTVELATTCKDAVAARALLAKHERQAELVRAGVVTADEADVAGHATASLTDHIGAYERHLTAKGCDPRRIGMTKKRLERVLRECGIKRLNEPRLEKVEGWFIDLAEAGAAGATRNSYRESLVSFGNWCRRSRRLTSNPYLNLPRADAKVDRPHQRRALTEAELNRLLKAARLRPIAEYGRRVVTNPNGAPSNTKSRATWVREPLAFDELDAALVRGRAALKDNPALLAMLEREGRERALIYRTLALTGLRRSELASITIAQVLLDAPVPHIVLNPGDEKNRKGATIPLRPDLAADLRAWIDENRTITTRADRSSAARRTLFSMPSGMNRIFDRDLDAAGIAKRDDRNRVMDIHGLRVTFATHLCAAGVPLRTAQAAMRHSKPELTANLYTDPQLLDVAGAIASLPAFNAHVAPPATEPASA